MLLSCCFYVAVVSSGEDNNSGGGMGTGTPVDRVGVVSLRRASSDSLTMLSDAGSGMSMNTHHTSRLTPFSYS